MSDTSPKANARYFELLRQAGPEGRLEICLGLSRATRELAIAGIKQAHPAVKRVFVEAQDRDAHRRSQPALEAMAPDAGYDLPEIDPDATG